MIKSLLNDETSGNNYGLVTIQWNMFRLVVFNAGTRSDPKFPICKSGWKYFVARAHKLDV